MIFSHRSAAIGNFLIRRANPHAGKPVMQFCLYTTVVTALLILCIAFDLWIATFSQQESMYAVGTIIAIMLLFPCTDAIIAFFYLSLGHTVRLAEEKRYHASNNSAWQFVAKEDP